MHWDEDETYLDREGGPRQDLQIIHSFLDVLGALDCASDCVVPRFLPRFQLFVDRRPHHNHSVAYKLNDIAAILVEVGDHALHVSINAEGEFFITSVALLGTSFRQVRETADVGKYDDCLHFLQLG